MNEQINSTESTDVKPCIKCGARDRYKSKACRACDRERSRKRRESNPSYYRQYYEVNLEKERERGRKYREVNPDKGRERVLKWQRDNPDKVRERDRKHYEANQAKVCERNRKWKSDNTDKINVNGQNRRARIKGNGGKLSKDIIKRLLLEQNEKCACCGADLSQTGYHLDHIMPLALGGINDDSNVQLLTPTCNMRKGAKHPDKWMPLAS